MAKSFGGTIRQPDKGQSIVGDLSGLTSAIPYLPLLLQWFAALTAVVGVLCGLAALLVWKGKVQWPPETFSGKVMATLIFVILFFLLIWVVIALPFGALAIVFAFAFVYKVLVVLLGFESGTALPTNKIQ